MRARHLAAFLALAGIWGTTWLTIKFVVREMPPVSAAGMRFVLAALLLAGFARWRGQPLCWRQWQPAERRLVLALSVLMIALPYGLVFYGELTVSSALASVLFSSHSAFVLLFDSLRARRNLLTGARLAGLLLAFAGIVVIFWPRLAAPSAELKGVVALVGAAASSALATVLAKHGGHYIRPLAGTTWQMALASVWLLAAGWGLERPALSGYSLVAFVALLYLVVFGSCVTFVLYYDLLKHMTPVQMSTLSFVIPVIATGAGWLVLGETLGPYTLAGAAAVVLGVALLHWREPEPLPAGD
ncbi:MAG: EamA family transporter [Acidobacteria bacterium]|nr:EamA family transporter [Acidobacteriota bacterium]